MYVLKDHWQWLSEHAAYTGSEWQCKTTKAIIQARCVTRSIWQRASMDGLRTMVYVAYLFCPTCTPQPELPVWGQSIYEDELIEVAAASSFSGG